MFPGCSFGGCPSFGSCGVAQQAKTKSHVHLVQVLRHGDAYSSKTFMFASLCFDLILGGVSIPRVSIESHNEALYLTAIGLENVRMASEESLSVRDMIGFKQGKVRIEGSGEQRKKKQCRVKFKLRSRSVVIDAWSTRH